MNEKIRVIAESGLLTKWQKDSQKSGVKEIGSGNDNRGQSGQGGSVQMKLRVEHVEGAFLAALVGLVISFIVFLFEILIHRLRARKKSHRYLKTIESFFCHA